MGKVLFINHTNDLFGAERVLVKAIQASGLAPSDIIVVEPDYHPDSAFRDAVTDAGYEVIRLSYKNLGGSLLRSLLVWLYNLLAVFRLRRIVHKEGVGCIWSNTSLCCLGVVTARLAGVRHVWHIHEPAEEAHDYVPRLKWLYKSLFAYPKNTFVFVTRKQQGNWERLYPALCGRSRLIYNPSETYQRHRVKDSLCRFGYLGSWSRRKNLPMLVEVFGQVHELFPDTELLMAQNIGDDAERIRTLVATLPDPQAIRIEPVEDVQAFFDRIDVLVLPSFSETWGIAAVEAMLQGIATVVTRQTALQEIAEDRTDIVYINPYDRQSLRDAMTEMCDEAFRRRIGTNGQRTMQAMNLNRRFAEGIKELL